MASNQHDTDPPVGERAPDPFALIADLGRRASDLERLQAKTRELGAKVYELVILNDLRQAIASVHSVEGLVDLILEQCTSLVGAREGSIQLFDPVDDELVLRAARGRLGQTLRGLPIPV